jgi:signal transduction histidine kinase/CheY-like chemotaxis protein
MDKTSVLIVEDEAIIAADLAGKLGQLGYEIAGTAASGEEAVEMACRLRPDVVLMDIRLKGAMDGIEAADAVRRRVDLPVIYLTAHSDAATLARAKLTGPFGYILKPFEERELATNIEMALYKHQGDKQLRKSHEELEMRIEERTQELKVLNETLEEQVIERTAQLKSANETLRASRVAALNLMEDAVIARREADETSNKLRLEIAERKRAEKALRESYQRTSLMAETTSKLLASDSPQKVVEELCRRVMEVLDCQAFFNFLVDEKADRLRLNACAGIPEEEVKKLEWLDYGVAVCGCAARDACRIVAEDIPNKPDPRTELVKSFGIRAYACHPLMARGRVMGTLSFGTRTRPVFTADELSLMKTVADHVAIAMERKQAEEELKLAREAAEAASRAKSQFLANMSHELRTPMTGVLGMLEFTLSTPLEAQQRDCIETADKSARKLLRILNDILDLSKIEAGKLLIEARPFLLRNCVVGAVDILLPEARRKGLELSCAMADDLPEIVVGDQVRLLQILTNLCGNAFKFTEKGKVEVKVTTGGETPDGKREFTFTVADTGIGIPDDKKELIFGSFDQADISHTRRFGGTGLGLAISRELVERMGGTITCISEEGKGSTFSFTIPLEEALTESETVSKPVAPPPAECAPVSSSEMIKARLLLAEDDPISRQVVGMMLKYANFDHEIAENGMRAVEMWEKGNYDLILMDVQMPVLDGFAATGAIRERERERGGHTLIVAMTAHAFPEDEKRCLVAGMDAYIPKPIELQKCIAVIEELIGKRAEET